jgi:hypothetical protein
VIEKEFAVFLSHDWGQDNVNHKKVKYIASLLETRDLKPWFDDSNITGNMRVADAIRKSQCFVIFLTSEYNEMIKRGYEDKSWCYWEFSCACYALSPMNILVVVLEEEMTKRQTWAPALQFITASSLYFDLSGASKQGDIYDFVDTEVCAKLVDRIQRTQYDSHGLVSSNTGMCLFIGFCF